MVQLRDRIRPADWPELIGRCVVSLMLVLLTQSTQFLVPQFFSDFSVFLQLLISGISLSPVLLWSRLILAINWEVILFFFFVSALLLLAVSATAGWCRRLLRVRASAPAFVFFSILFIWMVYTAIVRQGNFLQILLVAVNTSQFFSITGEVLVAFPSS